ncbi:MAG TPA: aminotransferase class III-fold pyridoxal phosphate-dependent enzyme, partial [Thermomicrobiales bacterium]|nr:aminotransferase class III-fold pyridoxal phosphate-dependent enzyme [Thermomicrobiales bacterium]
IVARILAMGAPGIRAVRGKGLMIGIELKQKSTPILKGLQERGVLTLPAGSTVLRLLPPLIWEQQQVDEFIAALGDVLA